MDLHIILVTGVSVRTPAGCVDGFQPSLLILSSFQGASESQEERKLLFSSPSLPRAKRKIPDKLSGRQAGPTWRVYALERGRVCWAVEATACAFQGFPIWGQGAQVPREPTLTHPGQLPSLHRSLRSLNLPALGHPALPLGISSMVGRGLGCFHRDNSTTVTGILLLLVVLFYEWRV